MIFLGYPRCSTSNKAQKWADEHHIACTFRHIKDDRHSEQELRAWHRLSGLPLKRFFNTSGMLYKELQLKDKLPQMSEDEQFALLASDGLLVKRPMLIADDFVLVGFKEAEWAEKLGV